MTAYWTGDIPAEPIIVEPARAGMAIDISPFDTATVTLRDPAGMPVPDPGFTATIEEVDDEDVISISWPDTSLLAGPGVYELGITLTKEEAPTSTKRETLTPVRVVVQSDDGWQSLDSIRSQWADADLDDYELYTLLWIARQQVLEYAPTLEEGQRPPINYQQAQLIQATNIWNANKVDTTSGDIGMDTFTIRPFPLDWMIKQMLRPKSATPAVG